MDRFRLFDFLQNLVARRPAVSRKRPTRRPWLERLEDRIVPTTITGVTPAFGPTAGSMATVQILGSGFTGATSVSFGGSNASIFNVVNDGQIDVNWLPMHAAGVVDVAVTAPGGVSTTSSADQFSYFASTTTTLSSSADPSTVGQSVTLMATVSNGGQGTPTGQVTFKDGTTVLGTGTLSPGG